MPTVLGVNGAFIFTGVPEVVAPIEIAAERIMGNLVLNNQVICGTVNAGCDAVLSRGGIKSVIAVA